MAHCRSHLVHAPPIVVHVCVGEHVQTTQSALVLNDFWSRQHTLVQMIMMVPILVIFIPPFVVEQVMVKTMLSTTNCLVVVACLAATIMVATALACRLENTQKLQSKYTKGHGK